MKKSHKKLEIVLLKETENLGQKGDKISVAKGYAINFLIPKKLAILFSAPEAEKILTERQAQIEQEKANQEKTKLLADKLSGLEIKIEKTTSSQGKLFGSVTKNDILKEIIKSAKIELGKPELTGNLPIKKPGDYQIKIKLAPKIEIEIKVKVSARIAAKKKKIDKNTEAKSKR